MSSLHVDADHLLRVRGEFAVEHGRVSWLRILAVIAVGGGLYGLTMGALGGKLLGAVYSGIKLPLLLVGSTLVCLPSFYVFNALLGLRSEFAAALRGILAAQGAIALGVASLAPVTAFLYINRVEYPTALLWNVVALGLGATCGQMTLAAHYRPLIARDRRHLTALVTWFLLYVFVTIKIAWVLRPLVGDPKLETTFVREEAWQENPYTNLFWTAVAFVWRALHALVG